MKRGYFKDREQSLLAKRTCIVLAAIRCYARPHSRHYQNDMAAELSYDGKQSSHRIHMVVGRNTYLVAS